MRCRASFVVKFCRLKFPACCGTLRRRMGGLCGVHFRLTPASMLRFLPGSSASGGCRARRRPMKRNTGFVWSNLVPAKRPTATVCCFRLFLTAMFRHCRRTFKRLKFRRIACTQVQAFSAPARDESTKDGRMACGCPATGSYLSFFETRCKFG